MGARVGLSGRGDVRVPLRVSHIIFDVDGTLVDFASSLRTALEVAARRASRLSGSHISPGMLQAERDAIAVEPGMRAVPLRTIRTMAIRRVLSRHGLEGEDAVEAISAAFFEARDAELRAFDDVDRPLAELESRGFTLIAASNGNAALDRLPIARRFAHTHSPPTVGTVKPDPGFFLTILELTGGRPQTSVSVGDRLENDYLPPRSIGMHAVLVDRAGTNRTPGVMRVPSLLSLPGLLEPVPGRS